MRSRSFFLDLLFALNLLTLSLSLSLLPSSPLLSPLSQPLPPSALRPLPSLSTSAPPRAPPSHPLSTPVFQNAKHKKNSSARPGRRRVRPGRSQPRPQGPPAVHRRGLRGLRRRGCCCLSCIWRRRLGRLGQRRESFVFRFSSFFFFFLSLTTHPPLPSQKPTQYYPIYGYGWPYYGGGWGGGGAASSPAAAG